MSVQTASRIQPQSTKDLVFQFYHPTEKKQVRVTCQILNHSHFPALFALDKAAYDHMENKANYMPLNQAEADYMQAIGAKFFGLFADERLIAYYTLWPHDLTDQNPQELQELLAKTGMDNLAKDLPFIPQAEWSCNIEFHRALFHPDYQDFGINQYFLPKMFAKIQGWGYLHLTATISPFNCPSFISAIKSGLTVGGLETKYGDFIRYIMYKDLQKTVAYQNCQVLCDHKDLAKQQELLSQGYRGKGIFKDPYLIDEATQKPKVFIIYDTIQEAAHNTPSNN